jgi:hypothetical protein
MGELFRKIAACRLPVTAKKARQALRHDGIGSTLSKGNVHETS